MEKAKKTLEQILRLIAHKTIDVKIVTSTMNGIKVSSLYNIIGYYKGNLIGTTSYTIDSKVYIDLIQVNQSKKTLGFYITLGNMCSAEFSQPKTNVAFKKLDRLYNFINSPSNQEKFHLELEVDEDVVDNMLHELLDIIIEITQDQSDYNKTTEDQFATAIQEVWRDLKYNSFDIQKISSDAILHGLWQPSTISPYNVIWYQINNDNGLAVYYDDTFSIQSSLCSLELSDNNAPLFVVNKEDLDELGADDPIHLLINEFIGNFCNIYPSQIFEADLNGDLVFNIKPNFNIEELAKGFIDIFACLDMYK